MASLYTPAENSSTFEATCQPGNTRPFRLYSPHSTQFQIQAYPKIQARNTIIHIKTKSSAIVTYILGPTWEHQLGDNNSFSWPGITDTWTETDEELLAQRILMTGGAVTDSSNFLDGYSYPWTDEQFTAFSRMKEFIFGWPDNGGVWVLHLNGSVPYEFWTKPRGEPDPGDDFLTEESIREMEEEAAEYEAAQSGHPLPFSLPLGAVDTRKLNKARTMSEYCDELKSLGAVYYEDPSKSQEVQKVGVLDRDNLTKVWPGFETWKAGVIEERSLARLEWLKTMQETRNNRSSTASTFYNRCILM